MDKLEETFESLKFHSAAANSLQDLLYNSLLTFNGILITAFSIMVAINPKSYSPFILPFFITSLIPVVGIVALIFDMRQSAYAEEAKVMKEINNIAPGCFPIYPALLEKNIKVRTNKCSSFLRFLDKAVIVLSLFNPIFIFFIIIYSHVS